MVNLRFRHAAPEVGPLMHQVSNRLVNSCNYTVRGVYRAKGGVGLYGSSKHEAYLIESDARASVN